MSGPSLAELRATGQPDTVTGRRNEEHWAGRRYMRRLSPYGTWVFARLGWSPNAVTWLMIAIGVGAGAVVAAGGFAAALAAAVMIQVYLLLDCSDGELARWSRRTSVTGVYLDRVGHYLAEAALLAGLGIRAQGHYALSGGYVSVGMAAAICAILIKAETDNVIVARAKAGLAVESTASAAGAADSDATLEPVHAGLARARRLASALRLHRMIQAVELSLLVVAAAAIDALRGGLAATRVLAAACLVAGAVMVAAHLAAIMASRRLR
jgi:phosphatidylglycerophosphate synthase